MHQTALPGEPGDSAQGNQVRRPYYRMPIDPAPNAVNSRV